MKGNFLYIIMGVAMLLVSMQMEAQTDRSLIREGNRFFRTEKWAQAETLYRKALARNGQNPQAMYNLGCALMMLSLIHI